MTTSKSVPANMNETAEEMDKRASLVPTPEPMVTIQIDNPEMGDGMGDRKKSLRMIFKGAVNENPEPVRVVLILLKYAV